MIYYIYLLSLLSCLSYVGFKKRKPDLFTLTVLASSYYSSTLLFGKIYDPDSHTYLIINDYIYIFYAFLFFLLIVAIYIHDTFFKLPANDEIPTNELAYFNLFLMSLIFLIIFLTDSRAFFPEELGNSDASSFGTLYNLYWASILIGLVAAFRSKNAILKIATFLFLLTTLTAGSRAFFTIGCLSILLIFFQNKPPIRLLMSFKRLFIMVLGFIFLIVFKNTYQYLLLFDLEMLLEAATNIDLILFRLNEGGESIVILNFHHAISLYQESAGSFVDLVVIKIFPFISELYIQAFNFDGRTLSDIIDEEYYQNVSYGMASNIWGLFYYVSGPIGTLIFVLYIYALFFI